MSVLLSVEPTGGVNLAQCSKAACAAVRAALRRSAHSFSAPLMAVGCIRLLPANTAVEACTVAPPTTASGSHVSGAVRCVMSVLGTARYGPFPRVAPAPRLMLFTVTSPSPASSATAAADTTYNRDSVQKIRAAPASNKTTAGDAIVATSTALSTAPNTYAKAPAANSLAAVAAAAATNASAAVLPAGKAPHNAQGQAGKVNKGADEEEVLYGAPGKRHVELLQNLVWQDLSAAVRRPKLIDRVRGGEIKTW